MSTLLLAFKRVNFWHFVWSAVVLSTLLSLLLSQLIHGHIVWEYPFAATFIVFTVASLLIYLIQRLRNLEQALVESARHRAKDATERRRADNALLESQERFSSAFKDAAIGMALVGTDGQWLQVNPALCALVGYTEQELLATTFQAITHPDDLDADLAFVRQMLAGEIPTYHMEKRYFHKQRHIVWILLSVSLVRDPVGQPLYFISQIQDITERKQVQEKLLESEARFRAILDNSPTMIFLKDTEGRYLLVNRQFESMFHLDHKTIVGKTDVEIFSPQQAAAFQANDREVVQGGVPLQFEEVALHDDGPHTIPQVELDRVSASFLPPQLPGRAAQASPDDLDTLNTRAAQHPLFERWLHRNVSPHKDPSMRIVTLSFKRLLQAPGDASADQLDLVAELSDRFSAGEARVTHTQNLVLPWVHADDLFALWEAARDAGLASANVHLLTDMIACPGGDFCALANARSIPVAEAITERYQDLDELNDIGEIDLHISGCINSCGHHHSGHIGILGVDKDGKEWYQVTLGGSDGSATSGTAQPGKVIGPSFSAPEVPEVIEAVLSTYLAIRQDVGARQELFIETVRRVGLDPFKAAANNVRANGERVA